MGQLNIERPSGGFQTVYTQAVMEMVFAERRRQVNLGRKGAIPHPCEDPTTSWGYRLGVLMEEVGEVAKEVIEGRPYDLQILDECVHTAAVAIACAEGVMSNLGMTSKPEVYLAANSQDEVGTDSADVSMPRHVEILMLANAIYEKRNEKYQDMWRQYGLRGAMMQLRSAVERAWRMVWNRNSEDFDGDDLLDAINYAAIAYRCLTENIEGKWTWGKH